MPIHDWGRVTAGNFHDFHLEWISSIKRTLNGGVLPAGYYAMAEQIGGERESDVITLQRDELEEGPSYSALENETGGLLLAEAPPQVEISEIAEEYFYANKRNRVAVRHRNNHRVIAFIEIVSPGNKSSRRRLNEFVNKSLDLLERGIHLMVLDVHRPGSFDPNGIHGEIWSELGDNSFRLSAEKPLIQSSYCAGNAIATYVQSAAISSTVPDLPLFLSAWQAPVRYVNVPLEASYMQAFAAIPTYWREVLEAK